MNSKLLGCWVALNPKLFQAPIVPESLESITRRLLCYVIPEISWRGLWVIDSLWASAQYRKLSLLERKPSQMNLWKIRLRIWERSFLCLCIYLVCAFASGLQKNPLKWSKVVLPFSFLSENFKSAVTCKKHNLYLGKKDTAEAKWM